MDIKQGFMEESIMHTFSNASVCIVRLGGTIN